MILATVSSDPGFHKDVRASLDGHLRFEAAWDLGYEDAARLRSLNPEHQCILIVDFADLPLAMPVARAVDGRRANRHHRGERRRQPGGSAAAHAGRSARSAAQFHSARDPAGGRARRFDAGYQRRYPSRFVRLHARQARLRRHHHCHLRYRHGGPTEHGAYLVAGFRHPLRRHVLPAEGRGRPHHCRRAAAEPTAWMWTSGPAWWSR